MLNLFVRCSVTAVIVIAYTSTCDNIMARRHLPTPLDETTSLSSNPSSPEPPIDDDTAFYAQNNDSQSSIEQPTCADRNMSPSLSAEEQKISINRLPPELLILIFARLGSPQDLFNCMLVSKAWSRNCVDLLWHRPLCNSWENLLKVVHSVRKPNSYYPYFDIVKRLNLSNLSNQISDGTVQPFVYCKRIERLTLTGCVRLTDHGVITLVKGNESLLALDITGLDSVTDHTLHTVADNCVRLQGLNISDCSKVTDESLSHVARTCKYLKRVFTTFPQEDLWLIVSQLKLNNCSLVTDESITTFAELCPSMLEIDLHNCRQITDFSITALISRSHHLRELRLAHCNLITDNAFLTLPLQHSYESLRILDLTACHQLHDLAVERIIEIAPRLRNLVLAKCKEITDRSVLAITKLGKNLHYIHLGHCQNITDHAVVQLVKSCNRIRYIDLACCHRLTDASIKQLATLPKLRRIGLVKCQAITDRSIFALAKATMESKTRALAPSHLERVHLSYCIHLTLQVDLAQEIAMLGILTVASGNPCTPQPMPQTHPS